MSLDELLASCEAKYAAAQDLVVALGSLVQQLKVYNEYDKYKDSHRDKSHVFVNDAAQLQLALGRVEEFDLEQCRIPPQIISTAREHLSSTDPRLHKPGDHAKEIQADGTGHEEGHTWPLDAEEYLRYGRQLIMPEIGLKGQLRLGSSSVLIIGLGGLGCPAAHYLVGAGVQQIGLVDIDVVEKSNLHRQILHSTRTVGLQKVESAARRLGEINPLVDIRKHAEQIDSSNFVDIMSGYDLILDCTDRPTSRYLISDACVVLNKQLISASALRVDGQMVVLNDPPLPPGDIRGGPCYRCIWPVPPPPETVQSCGEGGILGPVVGVMGVLMALEAIKLIADGRLPCHASEPDARPQPSMLLFSAYGPRKFQTMKLKGRRETCQTCSAKAVITEDYLTSGKLDLATFCGTVQPINILSSSERIQPGVLAKQPHGLLVDVRESVEFELASLPGSINIPFSTLQRWKKVEDIPPEYAKWLAGNTKDKTVTTFICGHGNDSQLAIRNLQELGIKGDEFKDVVGGLEAWRRDVDPSWPKY